MRARTYRDEDADLGVLNDRVVATVCDSGVLVVVGNRADGYPDELYLSGEPAEVFARVAATGLLGQLRTHSRTSQYGELTNLARVSELVATLRTRFTDVLEGDILSGRFAVEWTAAGRDAEETIRALRDATEAHALIGAERAVRERQPSTKAAAQGEARGGAQEGAGP